MRLPGAAAARIRARGRRPDRAPGRRDDAHRRAALGEPSSRPTCSAPACSARAACWAISASSARATGGATRPRSPRATAAVLVRGPRAGRSSAPTTATHFWRDRCGSRAWLTTTTRSACRATRAPTTSRRPIASSRASTTPTSNPDDPAAEERFKEISRGLRDALGSREAPAVRPAGRGRHARRRPAAALRPAQFSRTASTSPTSSAASSAAAARARRAPRARCRGAARHDLQAGVTISFARLPERRAR